MYKLCIVLRGDYYFLCELQNLSVQITENRGCKINQQMLLSLCAFKADYVHLCTPFQLMLTSGKDHF